METYRRVSFVWRLASSHTIAYFIAGLFAISFLKYDELFNAGELSFMRPTTSPWVAMGPALQLVRGIILGLVLFPFRSIFLNKAYGWLHFWVLTFVLSYLLTTSAAIGSFEGLIYTNIPLELHMLGLPEILLYNTIFTLILWYWYKKPAKWVHTLSIVLVAIIVLLSSAGMLSAMGYIES